MYVGGYIAINEFARSAYSWVIWPSCWYRFYALNLEYCLKNGLRFYLQLGSLMFSNVQNVAHVRNCFLSLTPTVFVPSRACSRQHSDLEDQNERRKKRSVLCFVYSFFEKCSQVWEPVCELHDPAGRNPSRHLARMIRVLWLVSRFYSNVS